VIAGVGPGLGASLSRRFAKDYTVVVLARSKGTLDSVSESIKESGGDVSFSRQFTSSIIGITIVDRRRNQETESPCRCRHLQSRWREYKAC
jgi:hypothetical protein